MLMQLSRVTPRWVRLAAIGRATSGGTAGEGRHLDALHYSPLFLSDSAPRRSNSNPPPLNPTFPAGATDLASGPLIDCYIRSNQQEHHMSDAAARPTNRTAALTSATETICSLALLKVQWDRNRSDYVENFLPFLADALRHQTGDLISLHVVQEALLNLHGLRLPQSAISVLLRRAAKKGYVVLRDHRYYRQLGTLEQLNFSEALSDLRSDHAQLLTSMVDFAKQNHNLDWTEADASSGLSDLLRELEAGFLLSPRRTLIIPEVGSTEQNVFVAAQFAKSCIANQNADSVRLERIFQGFILAHALFLPNAGETQRKFKSTAVFLDTTLLLDLLGYRGPSLASPRLELINLLRGTGAELKCFMETIDEVEGALRACARAMRSPELHAFGPGAVTVEHFTSLGMTASDVELLAATARQKLAYEQITIVPRPEYANHAHVIDEAGLEQVIKDHMPNQHDPATVHDVHAVASVMRMRNGYRTRSPEDCRAIFVTTNAKLVRVVRAFLRQDLRNALPPCMTDTTLTYLLWLKAPTVAPQLPLHELAAACFAAVQPDSALWGQFISQTDRLKDSGGISQNDYFLLRFDLGAREAVAGKVLGDGEAITEGTILDVLRMAKEAATREEHDKRREAEQRLDDHRSRQAERVFEWRHRTETHAKLLSWAGFVLIGILITGVALASLLNAVALWAYLILCVVTLIFGTSVITLRARLEVLLGRFLRTLYSRISMLDL